MLNCVSRTNPATHANTQGHSFKTYKLGRAYWLLISLLVDQIIIQFTNYPGEEEVPLSESCNTLRALVTQVDELLKSRRTKLEASQHLHKFYEDVDNEDEWIG